MTLSIIIPVYNVEAFLAQCLDSVFRLNYTNFEVLCIDDGSTDGSMDILKDYALKYPNLRIIHLQHNGASAVRNRGIAEAVGDYLFFLDSDDFILYPETLLELLQISKKHEVDVCFFNALVNGESLYVDSMPSCNQCLTGSEMMTLFYNSCRTIPTPVWVQLFRRSFLIDSHLRQKEDSYHEDELFTPSLLYLAKKVICINKPVVHYRLLRQGAVTTQYGDKYYRDWVNIARDLYAFFNQKNVSEEEPYRQVFGVYIQLADLLYSNGLVFSNYLKKEDYIIMSACAKTDYEKKSYRLAQLSPKLMYKYRQNKLPKIVRKMINRWL